MDNENINKTRRGFLTKLGIGSLLITGAGIFKVKTDINDNLTKSIEVESLSKDEIVRIAGSILDAIDGIKTDPVIYDAVRAHLNKGTIYEEADDINKEIQKWEKDSSIGG